MALFDRILYPTDFSPLANHALKYVEKLREAGTKEVFVIHVVADLSVDLLDGTDLIDKKLLSELPETDVSYINSIILKLNKIKKVLIKDGLLVNSFLLYGNIHQILKLASDKNVKVVVMGAHGKSLLSEFVLGSVSADVVRNSKCPVLIVKGQD
ncbi:MAG: universal stress protein [Nitrospiraceae bacterium]|nr:universal stress protein [Nitrospiraceae bacterium]